MPAWLEILIAALTGAVISVAAVGLAGWALYTLRGRLYDVEVYVFELLLLLVAPVTGGAVGVAIASGIVSLGIDGGAIGTLTIVAMGALIGGIAVPVVESTSDRRAGKSATGLLGGAGAGLVFGAIIGVFLATIFLILRAVGWV